jgi:hypothetical protein
MLGYAALMSQLQLQHNVVSKTELQNASARSCCVLASCLADSLQRFRVCLDRSKRFESLQNHRGSRFPRKHQTTSALDFMKLC